MVDIKKIYVHGYKNIKDTTIRFNGSDQPITLLLAPNNYGKTNLLSAINFAARLVCMGNNEQEECIRKNGYMSRNKPTIINSFTFAIEFNYEGKNYDYSFEIAKKEGVLSESLVVDGEESFKRERQHKQDNKDERGIITITEKGKTNKFPLPTHLMFASIHILKAEDFLGRSELRRYTRVLRNVFSDIAGNMLCSLEELLDDYTDVLSNDVERDGDLGEEFIDFYEKDKERFNSFRNTFKLLFPYIEDFRLVEQRYGPPGEAEKKRTADAYRLEFDPKWKYTEFFHDLSRGTRGIFVVLLVVFLRKGVPLLAIEEIENGIHPSLYRDVLNTLADICGETTKILITTHSPSVTRHFYKGGINGEAGKDYYSSFYVGYPYLKNNSSENQDGYATLLPLKPSKHDTINNEISKYSISIGELLFDMMTNSDETIKELREWLGNE